MKKFFTLIFSIALMQSFGQSIPMQVVASAGGNYSSTSISISWTLGEPVISTLANSTNTLILTQGFQQGNLFSTNVTEEEITTLDLKMYPNPAIYNVNFVVTNPEAKGDFMVEVFDVTGRKILNENLGQFNDQNVKTLPVSSLKSGIYFIRINIGAYKSEVLKLIKE